jgi:serine/threonine protein kinase/tetratricopeptide (TPR) repeat protein
VNEESIFAAALAIPSPTERAAYLDRACAGQPELRREVEQLLDAHADDNLLDRPPAHLGRTGPYEPAEQDRPAATVGDRIGPYRLMEQIGEGGFGLVFVAEQSEPVRRKVALKVLKPGMDTRDIVGRFEAERQALALMDHPNIAKVLDGGNNSSGRPYFVMELVRGVPITEYCDENKLPPRDRLSLFVQVCHAVQHAHQKGIIHRDIKPSNVLVTSHDGVPVPKVIDFGVAKAIGQSLTDKTIYTRFAQLIGTPLYMSPEQAEMSGLDMDTRADVYALGVLLYELLTGTTPFDKARFRTAAFDEIRRIIREEDPPRPSTRLSSLGGTLSAVSANRKTDPAKLAGLVRGELDWIVMRCLEKDRSRRYETANGLAKDVQRYLAGDTVEACPPTFGYRLRKAYRRNRAAILTAGAFALLLVAATAVSVAFATQARRAAEDAVAERDHATAAEARAAAEAATARAVNEFFCRDVFGRANPLRSGDRDLKVRTVLDEVAPQIEAQFAGRPLAEASVRHAIGDAYLSLGELDKARPQLERAFAVRRQELGDRHPDTLLSQDRLSHVPMMFGDFTQARALAEDALQKARESLGEDHSVTLDLQKTMATVLGTRIEAEKHAATAEAGMSRLYGRDDPRALHALAYLAKVRTSNGLFDAAEADIRRGLEAQARMPEGLAAAGVRGHFTYRLAELQFHRQHYDEAAQTCARALDDFVKVWGEDNPGYTGNVRARRGEALQFAVRYTEAAKVLTEAEASYLKKLPPNAPSVVSTRWHLARCLLATGHRAEAAAKARAAMEGADVLGWRADGGGGYAHAVLAACLTAEGKYAEAERHLLAAHEGLNQPSAFQPGFRPMIADIYRWTAELYEAWGKPEQAAKWRTKLKEWRP